MLCTKNETNKHKNTRAIASCTLSRKILKYLSLLHHTPLPLLPMLQNFYKKRENDKRIHSENIFPKNISYVSKNSSRNSFHLKMIRKVNLRKVLNAS